MNQIRKTSRARRAAILIATAFGLIAAPGFAARKPAASSAAQQPSKADVVARLRALQTRLTQEIGSLEGSIKKRLQESTSITLKEDPGASSRRINRVADQLADIDKKRSELLARREFVDQLTLQVESKWNGQNLQSFLERTALDMSVADLTNPQGSGEQWRFLTFLSIAIREVPTGRDDVIGILEDYMNFASVLNPKSPADFLAGRDYTGFSASVSAHPVPRAEAGDDVEDKLKSERPAKPSHASAPKPDIEIRIRAPIPQPKPEERENPAATPAPPASNGSL